MSVLIKGMKMPTSCSRCALFDEGSNGDPDWCNVMHQVPEYETCPLVHIPPHGDLIDLKAPFKAQYYDEMTEEWLEKMVTVEEALYGCMVDEMPPTIIPAEEGET